MKNFFIISLLVTSALVFYNCHGSKKATAAAAPATTYETSIKTVIAANCSPCHIPAKGGNKEAFDTYDKAKTHIDNMIMRIELNPGDKGFMPFKHAKLNDSTIAVFKQWRTDGLTEK